MVGWAFITANSRTDPFAFGGGTVTARNLHDPVVATPEPTDPSLLLLGVGFAFALRNSTQVSHKTKK
jgi:hypothetical protein